MKAINTIFIILITVTILSGTAESATVKTDNGVSGGYYSDKKTPLWEESACLKPAGPCTLKSIQLYMNGTKAQKDSVLLLQDPTDGGLPPTKYVWNYTKLCPAVEFNYNGTPGWVTIDISSLNLHYDGIERIIVQHIVPYSGPYISFDSDKTSSPLNSYICNANQPNPDFYNIRGTLFYRADGDYMVRLDVDYDFPEGETSQSAPTAPMLDVTVQAGIKDGSGNPLKAALVSVVDWNYDGLDDIAVGSTFFQNNGDGTFKNVSKPGVVAGSTVWADYNNDGIMDFFANNGGVASETVFDGIYTGQADGSYQPDAYNELTMQAPTVTPMWLDYNTDGLLDMFIAYGRTSVNDVETYFPDQLFINNGGGRFSNVTKSAKISLGEPSPYYDCWGASICDYNNDCLPDIFVATYRLAPDKLYKNLGDGTFQDVSASTGAQGTPTNAANYFGHGMGSDWCDFNNDGFTDLAVGNLGHPDERGLSSNPSLILVNQGGPDFKFTDRHKEMGLKFFEMNAGILWSDFNLDSYADLFHCQYSYNQKGAEADRFSRIYINSGPAGNYKLIDKTWDYGCLIHGAWSPVQLDFDNDGDMDLLVASSNETLKLFRNDLTEKGNWISFRVQGDTNLHVCRDGYGINLTVYSGTKKIFRQLPGSVMTARCSQSTNEILIGLGDIDKIDSVTYSYRLTSGTLFNMDINRKYLLKLGAAYQTIGTPAPMLTYPANDALLDVANPACKWKQIAGATFYKVQYSETKDFSTIKEEKIVEATGYKPEQLATNKAYYWRVGNGDSWSSTWTFTTGAVTAVENPVPVAVQTLSVTPNPVQSLATICLNFDRESYVTIEVYSMLGVRVCTLASTAMESGSHSLLWDTGALTPGVYTVVAKIGNDIYRQNIVVVR